MDFDKASIIEKESNKEEEEKGEKEEEEGFKESREDNKEKVEEEEEVEEEKVSSSIFLLITDYKDFRSNSALAAN
ncbi:hypothetical protein OEA41_009181 [Lepraria neglecta]|uniref:Uncharacterized protein n=1 Tax=Lepraria neglecta TaxID=209136 RepID=A0AAE0DGL6_9LECA|nr:hypothetical protein OEA41_009181 [Lepraria neglecta]